MPVLPTELNPYAPPIGPQSEKLLIYERTRCQVGRFWPECEVRLYEDRLEITSPTLFPRTIPTGQLIGLSSGQFLGQRHLIVKFSSECEFEPIRIQTCFPGEWYNQLESLGVTTQDDYGFRTSKQVARKLLFGIGWIPWFTGFVFLAALVFAMCYGTK